MDYEKCIGLCEEILTIAYDTENARLEFLAHELKSTLELIIKGE